MSSYYRAFNHRVEYPNRPLCPTKKEFDAYQGFINKKTGKQKEFREMTLKQMAYHNYIFNRIVYIETHGEAPPPRLTEGW
jgi:hypothetical protein